MTPSGNVRKYAVSHQYQQYDGILTLNMVYSSKIFLLLYLTNLKYISAESAVGKKQSLLTNQEPEGT